MNERFKSGLKVSFNKKLLFLMFRKTLVRCSTAKSKRRHREHKHKHWSGTQSIRRWCVCENLCCKQQTKPRLKWHSQSDVTHCSVTHSKQPPATTRHPVKQCTIFPSNQWLLGHWPASRPVRLAKRRTPGFWKCENGRDWKHRWCEWTLNTRVVICEV